jgi:hypothetical protein
MKNTKPRVLVIVGSALLIIGSFMPWGVMRSVFGTMTVNGMEGDGLIIAGIGMIILLIAVLRDGTPGRLYSNGAFILSLIAGIVSVLAIGRVSGIAAESEYATISTGAGLYACLLGATIAVVGASIKIPKGETS